MKAPIPRIAAKTTAGPCIWAGLKLRGTTEAFAFRLFGAHVTKTTAPESLMIASFVHGLPVRDVEAALADAPGQIRRPAGSNRGSRTPEGRRDRTT